MFSIDDDTFENTVTLEKCFYKTQKSYTYGFQWPPEVKDTIGFCLADDMAVSAFERIYIGTCLAFVTLSDDLLTSLGWKCGTVLRWNFCLNHDSQKIVGFKI